MSSGWRLFSDKSDAFLIRGDLVSAASCLEDAVKLAEVEEPNAMALLCNRLAKIYFRLRVLDKAERVAFFSIRWELEFGSDRDGETKLASYYIMLAEIYEHIGRLGEAVEYCDKALIIFGKTYDSNDSFIRNLVAYKDRLERGFE